MADSIRVKVEPVEVKPKWEKPATWQPFDSTTVLTDCDLTCSFNDD